MTQIIHGGLAVVAFGASLACSGSGEVDRGQIGNAGSGAGQAGATGSGGDTGTQVTITPTDAGAGGARGDATREDCDTTVELVVRDFNSSHPDMESDEGAQTQVGCGMVMEDLYIGSEGTRTPLFQASNGTGKRTSISTDGIVTCTDYGPSNPEPTNLSEIDSEETFNQWYTNVDDINSMFEFTVNLEASDTGDTYFFDSGNAGFFPADGQGFNELTASRGQEHNFHFTTEAHLRFAYLGGERFTFSGDDDMWIFVNGKLALDLGGIHSELTATIDLDSQAADLGISPDNTYHMDIFHAERHTAESNYRIETNIACFEQVEVPPVVIR